MKTTYFRVTTIACLALAVLTGQACTHESKANAQGMSAMAKEPTQAPLRQQGAPSTTASTAASTTASSAQLSQADPNVPEAQYAHLNSGYEVTALFYALSGMPPNYESLAMAASQEYRSTNDQFRKRDLLQALKPRIDQQIATYKDPRARYFVTNLSNGWLQLGHYDFNTGSFAFNENMSPDSFHYFNDASNYSFSFTNGEKFQRVTVKDEQRAKQIEDMVTRGQTSGEVMGYVFAQGADTAHNRVEMQIVKMIFYGPQHQELIQD